MSIDNTLDALVYNTDRMATALESIAELLYFNVHGKEDMPTYVIDGTRAVPDAATQTYEVPTPPQEAKPKRTRRSKAEIEAAAAVQIQSAPQGVTVEATFTPAPPVAPPPTPPVAPPVAPPAPPAPPPAAPPAPPAAPVAPVSVAAPEANSRLAGYAAMPVEGQFAELLREFSGYSNQPLVREIVISTATALGLGMPLSAPNDHSLPGDGYRGLSNEGRVKMYATLLDTIAKLQAA